jgi:hypothetical protein
MAEFIYTRSTMVVWQAEVLMKRQQVWYGYAEKFKQPKAWSVKDLIISSPNFMA